MGLLNGETVEDTEVILEAKNTQKWVKDVSEIDSKDLADGWFKLKNVIAGRFLTASSSTVLTVSGKNTKTFFAQQSQITFRSNVLHPQCPRTDLNKNFLPRPKTTTA